MQHLRCVDLCSLSHVADALLLELLLQIIELPVLSLSSALPRGLANVAAAPEGNNEREKNCYFSVRESPHGFEERFRGDLNGRRLRRRRCF